jgi:hypothetical protein
MPLLTPISAFNIFADLVLAIMPAYVISSLSMKKKVKIGLIVLMSLGILESWSLISMKQTTDHLV